MGLFWALLRGICSLIRTQTGHDIILYDNRIVVYKNEGDVMMYVVGGPEENEVMLYSVILALRDSMAILLKNSTDKRSIIENFDLVSLAIDEIVGTSEVPPLP